MTPPWFELWLQKHICSDMLRQFPMVVEYTMFGSRYLGKLSITGRGFQAVISFLSTPMDDILQPQYSLKRLSPRSPSTITMAGDIHDNSDAIQFSSQFSLQFSSQKFCFGNGPLSVLSVWILSVDRLSFSQPFPISPLGHSRSQEEKLVPLS